MIWFDGALAGGMSQEALKAFTNFLSEDMERRMDGMRGGMPFCAAVSQ